MSSIADSYSRSNGSRDSRSRERSRRSYGRYKLGQSARCRSSSFSSYSSSRSRSSRSKHRRKYDRLEEDHRSKERSPKCRWKGKERKHSNVWSQNVSCAWTRPTRDLKEEEIVCITFASDLFQQLLIATGAKTSPPQTTESQQSQEDQEQQQNPTSQLTTDGLGLEKNVENSEKNEEKLEKNEERLEKNAEDSKQEDRGPGENSQDLHESLDRSSQQPQSINDEKMGSPARSSEHSRNRRNRSGSQESDRKSQRYKRGSSRESNRRSQRYKRGSSRESNRRSQRYKRGSSRESNRRSQRYKRSSSRESDRKSRRYKRTRGTSPRRKTLQKSRNRSQSPRYGYYSSWSRSSSRTDDSGSPHHPYKRRKKVNRKSRESPERRQSPLARSPSRSRSPHGRSLSPEQPVTSTQQGQEGKTISYSPISSAGCSRGNSPAKMTEEQFKEEMYRRLREELSSNRNPKERQEHIAAHIREMAEVSPDLFRKFMANDAENLSAMALMPSKHQKQKSEQPESVEQAEESHVSPLQQQDSKSGTGGVSTPSPLSELNPSLVHEPATAETEIEKALRIITEGRKKHSAKKGSVEKLTECSVRSAGTLWTLSVYSDLDSNESYDGEEAFDTTTETAGPPVSRKPTLNVADVFSLSTSEEPKEESNSLQTAGWSDDYKDTIHEHRQTSVFWNPAVVPRVVFEEKVGQIMPGSEKLPQSAGVVSRPAEHIQELAQQFSSGQPHSEEQKSQLDGADSLHNICSEQGTEDLSQHQHAQTSGLVSMVHSAEEVREVSVSHDANNTNRSKQHSDSPVPSEQSKHAQTSLAQEPAVQNDRANASVKVGTDFVKDKSDGYKPWMPGHEDVHYIQKGNNAKRRADGIVLQTVKKRTALQEELLRLQKSRESSQQESRHMEQVKVTHPTDNTETRQKEILQEIWRLDQTEENVKQPCRYYDPGDLCCIKCGVNCGQVLGFLHHLSSKQHQEAQQYQPWQEEALQKYQETAEKPACTERFRGEEFLLSTPAFYCSLCKELCADPSVAEAHLKSASHNKKYSDYMDNNPSYTLQYMHERAAVLSKQRQPKADQRSETSKDSCASVIILSDNLDDEQEERREENKRKDKPVIKKLSTSRARDHKRSSSKDEFSHRRRSLSSSRSDRRRNLSSSRSRNWNQNLSKDRSSGRHWKPPSGRSTDQKEGNNRNRFRRRNRLRRRSVHKRCPSAGQPKADPRQHSRDHRGKNISKRVAAEKKHFRVDSKHKEEVSREVDKNSARQENGNLKRKSTENNQPVASRGKGVRDRSTDGNNNRKHSGKEEQVSESTDKSKTEDVHNSLKPQKVAKQENDSRVQMATMSPGKHKSKKDTNDSSGKSSTSMKEKSCHRTATSEASQKSSHERKEKGVSVTATSECDHKDSAKVIEKSVSMRDAGEASKHEMKEKNISVTAIVESTHSDKHKMNGKNKSVTAIVESARSDNHEMKEKNKSLTDIVESAHSDSHEMKEKNKLMTGTGESAHSDNHEMKEKNKSMTGFGESAHSDNHEMKEKSAISHSTESLCGLTKTSEASVKESTKDRLGLKLFTRAIPKLTTRRRVLGSKPPPFPVPAATAPKSTEEQKVKHFVGNSLTEPNLRWLHKVPASEVDSATASASNPESCMFVPSYVSVPSCMSVPLCMSQSSCVSGPTPWPSVASWDTVSAAAYASSLGSCMSGSSYMSGQSCTSVPSCMSVPYDISAPKYSSDSSYVWVSSVMSEPSGMSVSSGISVSSGMSKSSWMSVSSDVSAPTPHPAVSTLEGTSLASSITCMRMTSHLYSQAQLMPSLSTHLPQRSAADQMHQSVMNGVQPSLPVCTPSNTSLFSESYYSDACKPASRDMRELELETGMFSDALYTSFESVETHKQTPVVSEKEDIHCQKACAESKDKEDDNLLKTQQTTEGSP